MVVCTDEETPSTGLLYRVMKTIREDGYGVLGWMILWNMPGLRSIVIWRFTRAIRKVVSLQEALQFAMSKEPVPPISPNQSENEIRALCQILLRCRPRTVLEIGTERGGTLFLFTRVASPDAVLVSVDLPEKHFKPWHSLYPRFQQNKQKVFVVSGDSHAASTLNSVREVLGNQKIDFLFIDGDHSYEGVKRDYENYQSLLNDLAIVAFHDINPRRKNGYARPNAYSGEVNRFWAEVRTKYPFTEIVEDHNKNGLGIGVLFVKRA